jgi:hypothetical protein
MADELQGLRQFLLGPRAVSQPMFSERFVPSPCQSPVARLVAISIARSGTRSLGSTELTSAFAFCEALALLSKGRDGFSPFGAFERERF